MPGSLTAGLIRDFKEHAVWQVISSRIQADLKPNFDRGMDDSDPRSAGRYRAYEMVLGLPDRLLEEVESKGSGIAKRLFRR